MKFSSSPVVELSVGGGNLSIQQDNGSFEVGTSVWPCSLVLVKFAERWLSAPPPPETNNPYAAALNFAAKRGVEVGAGCGAAGMGLFLLGLRDVVLTDIPAVMPALKRNLRRNKAALHGKTLKHAVVHWNSPAQIAALKPPFDVVVAADVVYIPESVAALVEALAALVSPEGVVLLGYQIRCPDAHQLFWELAERAFHVRKVPHQDLHPDYAYEDSDVFILTKKNTL